MGKRGPKPVYASMEKRLLANTLETETGCWVWQLRTTADGYPLVNFWRDGKRVTARAHRLMFELLTGQTLGTVELDHQCHERRCIRPGAGHNMPSTRLDNLANRRGYAPVRRVRVQ